MKKLVVLTVIYAQRKSSAVVTADVTSVDGWDNLTVPHHIMDDLAIELGCPLTHEYTYIVTEDLRQSPAQDTATLPWNLSGLS